MQISVACLNILFPTLTFSVYQSIFDFLKCRNSLQEVSLTFTAMIELQVSENFEHVKGI